MTMESLSHGKPILASWAMHSDLPLVAELIICKYLKAGILVRQWEKRGVVTPADAICEVVDNAMASEEGLTNDGCRGGPRRSASPFVPLWPRPDPHARISTTFLLT
jgi:hypothetical protein